MELVLAFMKIFMAKVLELTLDTFRINFIVRGKKLFGSIVGFIEVVVWITVAREVMIGEIYIWTIVAYAGGYAAGCYLGSLLEQKLALGNVTVEAIVNETKGKLPNLLRDNGFGVSVIECRGKNNVLHNLLIIVANRKDLPKLQETITKFDETAFLTVLETKKVVNGYFVK